MLRSHTVRCATLLSVALGIPCFAACRGGEAGSPSAASSDAGDEAAFQGSLDSSADSAPPVDAPTDAPAACVLPAATTVGAGPFLSIAGDPPAVGGLADFSVFYPAGAPVGFAAYTNTPGGTLETHFARSTDGGATWSFVSRVNAATQEALPSGGLISCGGASSCPAVLEHEVATVVLDASDPDPARRFKIVSAAYLQPASNSMFPPFLFGYVALQTSADGQSWTSDAAMLGWNTTPTAASPALPSVDTNVNVAFPELADCSLLFEPGMTIRPSTSAVDPGAIDLNLSCIHLGNGKSTIRIVLLRSTDHAQTFKYVGEMLSTDDATCLGSSSPAITGGDLFFVGAQEYLVASLLAPSQVGKPGNVYLDCLVFAVDDSGAVSRNAKGHPTVVRQLTAADGSLIGSCSYAEGATHMGYVGNYGSSLPSSIFASGLYGP